MKPTTCKDCPVFEKGRCKVCKRSQTFKSEQEMYENCPLEWE